MFDGNVIKRLRTDKNLNQKELSEKLGITQANISSYETNRTRPDYEILEKLANYFDVSIDYLFGRSSENLSSLNDSEMYIIKTYRSLKEDTKIQFMSMVNMVKTLREIQKKNIG